MSIKRNLKETIKNVLGAATSLVKVASELTLEVSNMTVASVDQVIPVTKEILKIPVSAYAGWLEEDGMSADEAEAKASAMLQHELSEIVKLGSKESGKLLNKLFSEWDDEVTTK